MNWYKDMQKTIDNGKDMYKEGLISEDQVESINKITEKFSAKIPPSYLNAIKENNESDPIWRTVIPTEEELNIKDEELLDPIGDETFTPVSGVTHRYPDRLLLKVTHTCAVYCRYCFRRYAVSNPENNLKKEELSEAFDYIEKSKDVWEVILTGGDPLTLGNKKIKEILTRLRSIDHIKVIRFHTRVPVVLPSRIDEELLDILEGEGDERFKPIYIVTHINHAQEITDEVREACYKLTRRGIPLLNQCVLLKGTNDKPEIMEELLRKLIEVRIKPYYIHQGDYAQGTAHFRTTVKEGQDLMRQLRGRVSGICQPTYVLDIPGGYGKVPIGPNYLETTDQENWIVEDYLGKNHEYPPKELKTSNLSLSCSSK